MTTFLIGLGVGAASMKVLREIFYQVARRIIKKHYGVESQAVIQERLRKRIEDEF